MSSLRDVKFYRSVLENVKQGDISDPIFTADHQSITFSIDTANNSDFDIVVVGSIQKTPPDPASPVSETNQWTDNIAFIDIENGATYNNTSPYNPTGAGAVSKIFRVNVNELTWVFIKIESYSTGTLEWVHVNVANDQ